MTSLTRPRRPFLLALCAVLVGCGASRFDRLYESGRFEQAIALYEQNPDLRRDERTLYRAALMRSRSDGPVYDPEASRRDLRLLLERSPWTSHRQAILAHLALLDEVIRDRRERAERAAAVARLERTVASLRERSDRQEEEIDEREGRIERLERVIEGLRRDLEMRERRLAALERELERLKAIDLTP